MTEKLLIDGAFKIIAIDQKGSLTYAKIVFEGNEIPVKFKLINLDKVVEYIRQWFWDRNKLINPITGLPEERPLKQHLKYNADNLFYR